MAWWSSQKLKRLLHKYLKVKTQLSQEVNSRKCSQVSKTLSQIIYKNRKGLDIQQSGGVLALSSISSTTKQKNLWFLKYGVQRRKIITK